MLSVRLDPCSLLLAISGFMNYIATLFNRWIAPTVFSPSMGLEIIKGYDINKHAPSHLISHLSYSLYARVLYQVRVYVRAHVYHAHLSHSQISDKLPVPHKHS